MFLAVYRSVRITFSFLIIGLVLLVVPARSQEAKRIALVIDNALTGKNGARVSLSHDVDLFADALRQANFEVIRKSDLNWIDFDTALEDFQQKASVADVALFYYAGQAMHFGKATFLLPIGASLGSSVSLAYQTFSLEKDVLSRALANARQKIVVIDGTIESPIAMTYASRFDSNHDPANTRGLGPLPESDGLLIASAVPPGVVLEMRDGERLDYTTSLAKRLKTRGLEIRALLSAVGTEVRQSTQGRQVPFYAASPSWSDFYFIPPQPDDVAWTALETSRDPALITGFIARFPTTTHRTEAEAKLEELSRAQTDREKLTREHPDLPATLVLREPPAASTGSVDAPKRPPQSSALLLGRILKECDGCPELVIVPAGKVVVGSTAEDIENGLGAPNEQPRHAATIEKSFAVGRYDITVDQYAMFVNEAGYSPGSECYTSEGKKSMSRRDRSFKNPGYQVSGRQPAVCVSWTDANAYVQWLSRRSGMKYRLLSELEFEYLARDRTDWPYGPGSNPSDICQWANGADQTAKDAGIADDVDYLDCKDGYVNTSPVGTFKANSFGLYDMIGNVWQWMSNCYAQGSEASASDVKAGCQTVAVRGGSWSSPAATLRPAFRAKSPPSNRYDDVGFRVARDVETSN